MWFFISAVVFALSTTIANAESCAPGTFFDEGTGQCLSPKEWEDPDAATKPMSFRMRQYTIRAEATWIAAEGIITTDTPAAFKEFLQTNQVYKENAIVFHSPGGNLYAALELGRMIRELGNPTRVGRSIMLDHPEYTLHVHYFDEAVCMSACAYAFLGGEKRSLEKGDILGFHQFGSSEFAISQEMAQVASSDLARYIEEMGADQRLLQIASRTDFEEDIFIVTPSLASTLGIVADPSDRMSRLNVDLWRGSIVGNTTIYHQGFEYSARLHCIDKYPRFVLWADKAIVPSIFRDLKNHVAIFAADTPAQFAAIVDSGSAGGNDVYVTFSAWEIPSTLVTTGSLQLSQIYPRNWDALELIDRINWIEAGQWFAFNLRLENAKETVPIILKECG